MGLPRSPQEAPKKPQEAPKRPPRSPERPPGGPKEANHEIPTNIHEASDSLPRHVGGFDRRPLDIMPCPRIP
eukprot:6631710-Pyramimonas_sp.AAC.2